jgi:sugar/nucleoside kinase (ribokinase family)
MSDGLLAIGLTTLDILGRPIETIPDGGGTTLIDQIAVAPAGTAAGAALVASVLGVKTALASAIGNDAAGRFVRHELAARGVDTRLLAVDAARPTSTTILTIRESGERPNFHAVGASSFFGPNEALNERIGAAGFVHWAAVGCAVMLGGAGAALLAKAKAAGATVTCDLIGPNKRTMAELAELLPHVDCFMPNLEEALKLSGHGEPDDAAKTFLGMGARACVFKWGERGSLIFAGGERTALAAHAVDVVDTTSCGDSYCAGFIAARDKGLPFIEACRFATATAALVAQGLGTLGKLESFEATLAFMRHAPLRAVS